MLRHRFSNERWRAALNHPPLLFSRSLYYISELEVVLYYSVNMSYVLNKKKKLAVRDRLSALDI